MSNLCKFLNMQPRQNIKNTGPYLMFYSEIWKFYFLNLRNAGSGMGAAAVFERGDGVDPLSNARKIESHNSLSKDALL